MPRRRRQPELDRLLQERDQAAPGVLDGLLRSKDAAASEHEQDSVRAAASLANLGDLEDRIAAAAHRAADALEKPHRLALQEAEAGRDDAAAALAGRQAEVEEAQARLDRAIAEADAIRAHDPAVATAQAESEHRREELLRWYVRQGGGELRLQQLPVSLHAEARARYTAEVADWQERRERQESIG